MYCGSLTLSSTRAKFLLLYYIQSLIYFTSLCYRAPSLAKPIEHDTCSKNRLTLKGEGVCVAHSLFTNLNNTLYFLTLVKQQTSDEPTENDCLTLQLSSNICSILASFS